MKTKTINLTDIIPEGFIIDSLNENKTAINLKQIPKDIKEQIKTLQDAIDELGEQDEEVKFLRLLEPIGKETHILYKQQAVVIAKALNEGWIADYAITDQSKYEPRFYYDSSAGGFVFFDYGYWVTDTYVGSHLCFHSSELAKYFGNQFIEIHRKYL